MSVRAAFYTRRGDWRDTLIRLRTASRFSHVELVLGDEGYTSSPRDGGVRRALIDFRAGWELLDLPWADEASIRRFFRDTYGLGYDWLGVLVGQGLLVDVQSARRYFCSEWCAAALGLSEPWRYSPGTLYNVLKDAADGRYAFQPAD